MLLFRASKNTRELGITTIELYSRFEFYFACRIVTRYFFQGTMNYTACF